MNAGLMKLLAFVFDHLVKQKFLAGNRMYLGGASAILLGVTIMLDMVVYGSFSEEKAGAAWAAISLGYTVIGTAGKQDKLQKSTEIATGVALVVAKDAAVTADVYAEKQEKLLEEIK